MNRLFLIILLIAVILEAAADVLLKQWAVVNKNTFLLIGVSLYVIASLVWAYSLKFEALSKSITIFTVLNMIVVVLAGLIIFKEGLSLTNKVGIILGIIAVVLLQW